MRLIALRSTCVRTASMAFALGVVIPARGAVAQDQVVDEGSFTITRNGTEVGSETFSIRSTGSGEAIRYTALSRVHVSGPALERDIRSSLEIRGPEQALFDYQLQIVGDGQLEVRYTRDGAARMRMSLRAEEGVREREMRAPSGLLVLEAGIAHQFHFLGARVALGQSEATILSPASGSITQATIAELGVEEISIGGSNARGRRVRVTQSGGSVDLWFDSQWRVLRVEAPDGYAATRTQIP